MLTTVVGMAKASSERVQSDARISFAECEMFRVKPKDIKTIVVTTQPQMHCANCENKIKGNFRFEKGVKKIECNIPEQRVIITYDAEKTKPETIIRSFEKFGYKATEVKQDKAKGNTQK